ncbi:protein-ADP-ribose hydrolase [Vibrio sp. HN007]|uniref:protein-ADP-ribose hydrolase n=1 Tax=Vibrio iocasae TaxID=3098914 RepID=UPI0035D47843
MSKYLQLSQYQKDIALLEPFQKSSHTLTEQQEQNRLAKLLNELSLVIEQLGVSDYQVLPHKEQRKLLRAALNVIPANTLSQTSTQWLDELLQSELTKKEVTKVADLEAFPFFTIGSTRVLLWQGDITELQVDAIVNAANAQMEGCFQPLHNCIDNAIHSNAGVQLRDDCHKIISMQNGSEPTGQAKVTRAYNLPSKFVIHTVGPIVSGALTDVHASDLSNCYQNCLNICREVVSIKSIAFCAISTGVFGYPIESATKTALHTVTKWLEQNPDELETVVFNVFSHRDHQIYQEVMEDFVCQF